jgi:hypothetical protein
MVMGMAERVEYTVDDEMPDCGRCDHVSDDFKCCDWCGAEHGWWGYRRTEVINIDKVKNILCSYGERKDNE